MTSGRPKKYVTEQQLKEARKGYKAKAKNVNLPKEVVEEFIELKEEMSYSNSYPFKLTNPQFFRILLETYRKSLK